MSFKIEITDTAVNILRNETLYDSGGNPVTVKKHRVAVGLGDYAVDLANPTPEEIQAFRDAVEATVENTVGPHLAQTISEFRAENDRLRAENAALKEQG